MARDTVWNTRHSLVCWLHLSNATLWGRLARLSTTVPTVGNNIGEGQPPPLLQRNNKMDFHVKDIVWDTDGKEVNLPDNFFVSWHNDCQNEEEAVNFVSDFHGFLILSCRVIRD